MMLRLAIAISFVFCSLAQCMAEEQKYGQTISLPAQMQPDLQKAVGDLQHYLERMTEAKFTTQVVAEAGEVPASAILLRHDDAAGVPPAAIKLLPAESQEAVCVFPEGTRVWLISRSDTGLAHAIYLYLEHLGCRWYAPAESWTIVPQRKDIRLSQPLAVAPEFRSRVFAGTGGFGGSLPVDKQRTLQERWNDWTRRNRFGGEFRVSGHTGEAFNMKYRQQLEAHPQWRAMVDGKRVPWSITAKFCAGNQEVVGLYVQDRLDFYRTQRERFPDDPRSWAVSVEPADGGGHCTAPESLALGTVSDRVFHVANQVAKAVRKESPDGRVSLFAYNEHAGVPSIPLEPNVYVQVIPYAFQRTGLNPDQLLDAWSQKVSRMGIYDYWSIPDWSHDLPTFDPLGFGPDRLRGWHRRGVDSFLCESTYSTGAMGPAWYIAVRLAWDPDADERAIFNEFNQNCFGPAAAPMRRMLERWSQGFYLNSHELALSFRDVDEAWRLAEANPACAARVADYGRYVEYLRRRFEYLQTKRNSPERDQAANKLMEHLWEIYDSAMIHAFRHSQLLARDEKNAGRPELGATFNWQDHNAPGWARIKPLSDSEIRSLVTAGVEQLTPQDFSVRKFTGPLVPLKAEAPQAGATADAPVLICSNSLSFEVLAETPGQKFTARIGSEQPVNFLVTGPDGQQLVNESIATGAEWRTAWSTAGVVLPKPGLYRMQIVSQKRTFRFSPPGDVRLSFGDWWNSQGTPTPKLYFYVPEGTSRLAMYANYIAAGPPRFFDSGGNQVEPVQVDDGHLLLLEVPTEQQGSIWSLDRAKCPLGALQMLNAPQSFAFSPEELLVPQDALQAVQP